MSLDKGILKKKIWIDLDNSPHVPFFNPIIKELQNRNQEVLITTRDAFQVSQLADLYKLKYQCIGKHYGKNKFMKVIGTVIRALQLMKTVIEDKPQLAISHGSRAQLLASYILGIPSIVIEDYEYVKILLNLKPTFVFAPEIIPIDRIKIDSERIKKYPGIKEDVYVPFFKPDKNVKNHLGLSDDDLVVLVRPPATEAHYHNPESELLFKKVMEFLFEKPDMKIIILPRNIIQKKTIEKEWKSLVENKNIIIPETALNGLDLIWISDLVVSGGGTMNREAAALGVPVYSIFRGKIGAVDKFLSKNERLILIESIDDIKSKIEVKKRVKKEKVDYKNNTTLSTIINLIIDILKLPPK